MTERMPKGQATAKTNEGSRDTSARETAPSSPRSAVRGPIGPHPRLPQTLRDEATRTFGVDIDPTVSVDASLSTSQGADAAAQGNMLRLAPHALAPGGADGQLVRHEVAHLAQKRAGERSNPLSQTGGGRQELEADANAGAAAMETGRPHEPVADRSGGESFRKTGEDQKKISKIPGSNGGTKNAKDEAKTADSQARMSPMLWAQITKEAMADSLLKGYTGATRVAGRGLLAWLEQVQEKKSEWVDISPLKALVTDLVDGYLVDVAKTPALASAQSTISKKAEAIFAVSLTGTRKSLETIVVLIKQLLDALAHAAGQVGASTESTLASRKGVQTAGKEAQQRNEQGGPQTVVNLEVDFEAQVGAKKQKADKQSMSVLVGTDTLTLYQTFPTFKKLISLPRTSTRGKGGPTTLKDEQKALFEAWVKSTPPLPSGEFTLTNLGGQKIPYQNNSISRAVIDFFGKGSKYEELNKYAGWAVIAGGALCLLGFVFPPASVAGAALSFLGSSAVTIGTAIQLPSLIFVPGAEIAGGYRSFTGTDILNLMGVISAASGVAGALKGVGKALRPGDMETSLAKSLGKGQRPLRPTSPEESSAIRRLLGKSASHVVQVSNATADIYGIYLGSSSFYERLQAEKKFDFSKPGDLERFGALLFNLLGDIVCAGAGIQGTAGRVRSQKGAEPLKDAQKRGEPVGRGPGKDNRTMQSRQTLSSKIQQRIPELRKELGRKGGGKSKGDTHAKIAAELEKIIAGAGRGTFKTPDEARAFLRQELKKLGPNKWTNTILSKVKPKALEQSPGQGQSKSQSTSKDQGTPPETGPNAAQNRAAKGKSGKSANTKSHKSAPFKTNTSAKTVEPDKGTGKAEGTDKISKMRRTVRGRLMAPLNGMETEAGMMSGLKRIDLASSAIYATTSFDTAKGKFPTCVYTSASIQGALDAFQRSYNKEIVGALPQLAGKQLANATFAGTLAPLVQGWATAVDAVIKGLDESALAAIEAKPFLRYAQPLHEFNSALKESSYVNLAGAQGTIQQQKEVIFYSLIQQINWEAAYTGASEPGCVRCHTPMAQVPQKPSSPSDTFPAPPPARGYPNSWLIPVWQQIHAQQGKRIPQSPLGPAPKSQNGPTQLSPAEQEKIRRWILTGK